MPCCEPLRQAAAACWGSCQRRERAAAAGGGDWNAQGSFQGLRSGGGGAEMAFEIPIPS
jgi:hypothetical protein